MTAESELCRRYDGVVEYARFDGEWSAAHVRIWEHPTDPSRVVVLLGELYRSTSIKVSVDDLATRIDEQLLAGRGRHAVWFSYSPEYVLGEEHRVSHVVFTYGAGYHTRFQQQDTAVRPWWLRWLTRLRGRYATGRELVSQWSPSSLAEVERVTGAAVECYPAPAYTVATLARRQADPHHVVEAAHDTIEATLLVQALSYFDAVPAEHACTDTAAAACSLLAAELRDRRQFLNDRPWDDGTYPLVGTGQSRPTRFAARLTPPEVTDTERALLARYPGDGVDFDANPGSPARQLLGGLRVWRADTAPWADAPDETAYAALITTDDLLTHHLRVRHRAFAEQDHPDYRIRLFNIVGELDQRFLDGVTWQHHDTDSPRHRLLRSKFSPDRHKRLLFGTDAAQRLVAYCPAPRDTLPATFGIEWPLRVPTEPVPQAAMLVADGDSGDRPAYIEYPDGTLAPLPDRPRHGESGWNFGYPGGGPGALASAIRSLFIRSGSVSADEFPDRWLEHQVDRSRQDRLGISVIALHREKSA